MRDGDLFAPWWKPGDFDESSLGHEERKIFGVLRFHVGLGRAITIEEIKSSTGIAERKVRDVLKHLTEEKGLAIAASVQPPYLGVYLVDTAEELEDYCRQLRGRALSQLRRMAILKRQHLAELLGQMSLEVES